MPNPENIIPPQKGEVRNPNGKPKGTKNRSTIARKWLEVMQDAKNPITGELEKLSQEDLITLAMIHKARKGDVNAYKQLMDSGFGMPKQTIEQVQEQPIFNGIDLEVDGQDKPESL
jgi:predicted aspartyl protease